MCREDVINCLTHSKHSVNDSLANITSKKKINILLEFSQDSPQFSIRNFPCYKMHGNDAKTLTANSYLQMTEIFTIFQEVTLLSGHGQQSFEFIVIFNVRSSSF